MVVSEYMNHEERMPFFGYVFLAGLFAKQFYTMSSGSLQIGDMLFAASFVMMAISGYNLVSVENKNLLVFVVLTGLINGIFGVLYSDFSIMLSTVYFVFNLLVVLVFDNLICSEKFTYFLEQVLKLCLLSQLVIYLSGRGTYYYDVRYMGTFNDPNQYGFFILATFFMLSLMLKMRKKGIYLWVIITFFLIMPSASTGMALGLVVFLVMFVIFQENSSSGEMMVQLLLICTLSLFLYLFAKGVIHLPSSMENSFMAERLLGKLNEVQNSSGSVAHDRNWDKVFNNLGYIFIGCGEGVFWRFGNNNEVHSTVLGLIWYYGIIPCGFLVTWIRSKLIGISKSVWCVYVALFIEAITLVNHRQPMFWMLITSGGMYFLKSRRYQEYYWEGYEE